MTKKKQNTIERHANVTQFLEACDKEADISWSGRNRSSRKTDRAAWYGNVDVTGAQKLALYGWDNGLKQLAERMASIPKECEGRVVCKAIAGSHPDVARFVAGMPDCMNRRVVSDAARKPCLDIVLNCSYACNIDGKEIINYGAAMATHVDELENSGYSVSLTVGAVTTNNNGVTTGPLVLIKEHGQMLDLSRLVYFMAHPSFLRRLVFSHWEGRNTYSDLEHGYGCITDLPKEMQGDLYFGKQSELEGCSSIKDAMKFVRSTINAQMPELFTGGQRAA